MTPATRSGPADDPSLPRELALSPLVRLWLHGRWARSDAVARLDACLAMFGIAAIVLLL